MVLKPEPIADCVEWLQQASPWEKFGLIFLDPPSFSNSKRMDDTLDIQRDHAGLIRDAMRVLSPGGTLIFSNNLRSFRLDEALVAEFPESPYLMGARQKLAEIG